MRFYALIVGVYLGAVGLWAAGTNAPTNARTLSLDECLQVALQHNFDVQITRLNPEIARLNLHMSYGAYDPNLQVQGLHSFNQSPGQYFGGIGYLPGTKSDQNTFDAGFTGNTPIGMTYSISGTAAEQYGTDFRGPFDNSRADAALFSVRQPLLKNLWIDPYRWAIQINKKQLKISELGLEYQIMTTVTTVEQGYYDLISARENLKVQEKALELAQRLLSENKKRVEVGALAPLDEKQAESQVASSKADLLVAQQLLSNAQNAMKALLSDNYLNWQDAKIDAAETLTAVVQPFSRQESWRRGMTMRPDLLQSRQSLEEQHINVRYYRNQLFPQVDLLGSFGYSANGPGEFSSAFGQIRDGKNPSYSYGAQLTIPLTSRQPRDQLKISKSQEKQILLRLKQQEQSIMVQIENAIIGAQTAFERVDATKQARIYAQMALDAEQKKLENGKSTSFVVLQLQRDLTSAKSAEIGALSDYNKALAQLAFSEGYTLERRRISFEVKK